jgi:hypothetical protein
MCYKLLKDGLYVLNKLKWGSGFMNLPHSYPGFAFIVSSHLQAFKSSPANNFNAGIVYFAWTKRQFLLDTTMNTLAQVTSSFVPEIHFSLHIDAALP